MFDVPFKAFALSSSFLSYVLSQNLIVRLAPRLAYHGSFIGLFFSLFALQLAGFACWRILIYPQYFSPMRHLPGPKGGSWWNGHAKRILSEPNGTAASEWILTIPNNGLIRYLGILNSELLLVTSPEAYAEVATRNYDFPKDPFISLLAERILGPGLVLAEGDNHKRQRKMLMPAFTAKNTKALYPIFWEKSKLVSEKITYAACSETEKLTGSNGSTEDTVATIDLVDWTHRVALDIITQAALGIDFNSLENPSTPLAKAYHDVFELDRFHQFMAILKSFLPGWLVKLNPSADNAMVENASRTIRGACRKVLSLKRGKLARKELDDVDLISVLLRGGEINDEETVHQMMTFLAAGHETVTTGISWAIYMMCVYPEWQARLRAEIRERLPSVTDDRSVTSQEINDMVLLNAFINEVLRYWPPIPLTLRKTALDTTLIGQYVPKGTKLILALGGTNKDPKIWGPDAHLFRPERWISPLDNKLDPSGGASSKYGYLTFMHGPRGCIGSGFAKGEMACIISALVGRFDFDLVNQEEKDIGKIKVTGGAVSARPANGLWVKAKVIGGW